MSKEVCRDTEHNFEQSNTWYLPQDCMSSPKYVKTMLYCKKCGTHKVIEEKL